jgi:hypothetical protein
MIDWVIKNEMERTGKEMVVAYSGICVEGLSEITISPLHYSQ